MCLLFKMFTSVSLRRSAVTSIIKGNQVGGVYQTGCGTCRLSSLIDYLAAVLNWLV